MRKALLCIAVLLAFGLTAVAQDTGTSGQSSTTTTTTKKHTHAASSMKGNTITGCIEKSDDTYMIKNGRHKNGVKVTGSDDLSAHVGHTVKLTGSWASAAAASTSGTGETKGGGAKAAREFNETKVDMVSETCKMGGKAAASSSSSDTTNTASTKTKKSKKSTATTPQ